MNRFERVALVVVAVAVVASFTPPVVAGTVAGLAGLALIGSLGYRKVLK